MLWASPKALCSQLRSYSSLLEALCLRQNPRSGFLPRQSASMSSVALRKDRLGRSSRRASALRAQPVVCCAVVLPSSSSSLPRPDSSPTPSGSVWIGARSVALYCCPPSAVEIFRKDLELSNGVGTTVGSEIQPMVTTLSRSLVACFWGFAPKASSSAAPSLRLAQLRAKGLWALCASLRSLLMTSQSFSSAQL